MGGIGAMVGFMLNLTNLGLREVGELGDAVVGALRALGGVALVDDGEVAHEGLEASGLLVGISVHLVEISLRGKERREAR